MSVDWDKRVECRCEHYDVCGTEECNADRAEMIAEGKRLETENKRLRKIALDWLNTLCADGLECTCEDDDVCPSCRCIVALAGEATP